MESKDMFAPSRAAKCGTAESKNFRKLCAVMGAITFILSLVIPSYAAQSTLAWNAVTEPGVAGYKLHYGTVSGNYTQSVDAGTMTSCTVNDLIEGKTYYFAATSYDSKGNQSAYSNEVSKTVPSTTQYTLDITRNGSGSGTVTGSGINCGSVCSGSYSPGTVVTLSATPATGSTFAGWSGACSGTGSCVVTMNASKTVTATFNSTAATYDITATATGKGSITAVNNTSVTTATSGDTTISVVKVAKGASQQFNIAPNTGYYVVSVVADGTTVASNIPSGGYTYTFSNVTAAHSIAATFDVRCYHITASAGSGGTISPTDVWSLYNTSQTISIVPNSGYRVADVQVDGKSVGAVTSYTFSNIAADHTVSATFTTASYTITASAGTGGTISPTGTVTVSGGSSKTYTIAPKTRYRISDVKVNGVSKGAISSYTFSNIAANNTIQAYFTR